MEGLDLFATELVQYLFKILILGATIVAAVFTGIGIRKAINKKKQQQETTANES